MSNLLEINDFKSFIGQSDLIHQLEIAICGSKNRNEPLEHILLYGPPGLGKTTISRIIANELNTNFIKVNAPSIEKISDLISILSEIKENDILLIDEIHRLSSEIEEILYEAMESFTLSIVYKSSEGSKVMKYDLPKFTLIGATTDAGNLSFALRSRFSLIYNFKFYSLDELKILSINNFNKLNIEYDEEIIEFFAKRCRNTPRVCNNLSKRIKDYMEYYKINKLSLKNIQNFFHIIKIYEYGLNEEDMLIIKTLKENYNNVPCSLSSIACVINENPNNLLKINEPYLVFIGILIRSKRGRYLSKKGLDFYNDYIYKTC